MYLLLLLGRELFRPLVDLHTELFTEFDMFVKHTCIQFSQNLWTSCVIFRHTYRLKYYSEINTLQHTLLKTGQNFLILYYTFNIKLIQYHNVYFKDLINKTYQVFELTYTYLVVYDNVFPENSPPRRWIMKKFLSGLCTIQTEFFPQAKI